MTKNKTVFIISNKYLVLVLQQRSVTEKSFYDLKKLSFQCMIANIINIVVDYIKLFEKMKINH